MMKNLFILTALLTAVSISMVAQQPHVSEFLEKVPKGIDNPPELLPDFEVTFEGSHDPSEGYRMLYWVHGLNGEESSLGNPASATVGLNSLPIPDFPPRKVYNNAYISYTINQNNLGSAAAHAVSQFSTDELLGSEYNLRDGMVISHSQGGIVSRWIDRYYSMPANHHERKFGGIITLATPNQGAQIINNQKKVEGVMNEFAFAMTIGPLIEGISSLPFLIKVLAGNTIQEKLTEIIQLFSQGAGKYLLSGSYPSITKDYEVGASQIDLLNSYIPDGTFIVPFYSIREILTHEENVQYKIPVPNIVNFPGGFDLESKLQEWGLNIDGDEIIVNVPQMPVPISWANIEFFLHSPSDDTYFEAHLREHNTALNAHKTQYMYNAKRMAYNATGGEYHRRRNALGIVTGSAQFNAIRRDEHYAIRDAYQIGVEFLDQFDLKYRRFIGARVSQPVQLPTGSPQCQCEITQVHTGNVSIIPVNNLPPYTSCESLPNHPEISNYLPLPNYNPANSSISISCSNHFVYDVQYEWINKPSDGVVLAESAMNIPQATYEAQRIDGSTHMALRNDGNLKDVLRDIFEGEVGLFFETEEK